MLSANSIICYRLNSSLNISARLLSRTSPVTGTSGGLGRAIAIAHARQGANVVCADLAPTFRATLPGEDDSSTHEVNQAFGGHATFVQCDVAEPEDVKRAVGVAVDRFGRLDR